MLEVSTGAKAVPKLSKEGVKICVVCQKRPVPKHRDRYCGKVCWSDDHGEG